MTDIFARQKEIKILERLYHSKEAQFLSIYGRRRIGKTFLIRHFFKQKGLYFELTGIKNGSLKNQLHHFNVEFSRVFGGEVTKPPSSWLEAFDLLRAKIEESSYQGRIILFFDELPWLATPRSNLLQALDHFWNRYMSDDPRIIMIVCGSAASWMINKVIKNKGGLHGRLTAEIKLLPFDLNETEQFLVSRGVTLDRKQLIDIYMAIGGVAKYLTLIDRGQSSLQVISKICFEGLLFKEFDELYSSLFDNYVNHVIIVKALSECAKGLTKQEICHCTDLSSGGGLNMILQELEESGFIISLNNFGKKKKDTRFKLVDEYSLFYLKWIVKAKSVDLNGVDNQYWLKMKNSPAGYAWAGYAFETLCLKHVNKIKRALGISGVTTSESDWVYQPSKQNKDKNKGTQIDLLIDRADNCINLCEIKYANDQFVIDKRYASDLRRKKEVFIEKSQTQKSVFLTFITTYGVKKNNGEFDMVDVELTIQDLFY